MRNKVTAVRSNSAPTFVIPSAEMGRYEEVKERRFSAPVPSANRDYEGGRKWSGGLMPLSSAGCYGRTPVSSTSFLLKSTVHPSTSSSQSSQGGYKSKKLKTYSAYSVSKDCAIHGPALERSDDRASLGRRDSVASNSSSSSGRRSSSSSFTDMDSVEKWRASSSHWNRSSSTSSDLFSNNDAAKQLSYNLSQNVHRKPSRPSSFRRFSSFRSSLNEILYEEEEEEVVDEKKQTDSKIPFSFRHEPDDRMGVLGLSSVMRNIKLQDNHEKYYEDDIRKHSYNCHEM